MTNKIEIIEDYIPIQEENNLVVNIEKELVKYKKLTPYHLDTTKRSTVLRYGSDKAYGNYMMSSGIPDFFYDIFENRDIENQILFTSVTVNEYNIGDLLPYHIDSKESGEVITVLSLLGMGEMSLREKNNHKSSFTLELKPRSLLKLEGIFRWEWEHSILKCKQKRYSIVFRN